MRLPHHLLRHASGVWHFRLTVPRDLHDALGLRIIKRSLRTRDPASAQVWAYVLSAQYAQVFREARGRPSMGSDFDEYLKGLRRYEIQPLPNGLYGVKTNGSQEDNDGAAAALTILTGAQAVNALQGVQLPPGLLTEAQSKRPKAPTLADAILTYEETEGRTLKPNTFEQRKRSCAAFAKAISPKVPVNEITRPMASAWATDLLRSGLTKRYVANTVSHVAQIFEALIRAGHIPKGENPVKGVVVLKAAEKKALRAGGHAWESFEPITLKRIFDPANLKRTRGDHVRWGALIGLYSGARVSEVAQLFLRDFETIDGVPCMRLTADSDGQSLKTESSRRLVPIHPDLLRLGLWERVEALRARGAERLFPDMRIDSRAGAGNSISKSFSYYLGTLDIKPRRAAGIVGFHSLRKTVIQTLQGSDLPAERRRALVGHEAGEDVHAGDYMRAWSAKELSAFFPGLEWGEWLDFDGLRALL